MKRDKDFDTILNECLERLFRGETSEQCLQDYPGQAAELEPLLRTAAAVKRATTVRPDAVFRARAREEFHASIREMESRKTFNFFGLRAWATVAVAVVLAVLALGSGTVAASGSSLPGEALYPVKLVKEQVQVTLTFSEIGKAELYSRLADERVNEIVYLANKNDPRQVELATMRLETYLAQVAVLLEEPVTARAQMLTTPVPSPAPMLGVPKPAAAPETAIPQPTAVPAPAPSTTIAQAPPLRTAPVPTPAPTTTPSIARAPAPVPPPAAVTTAKKGGAEKETNTRALPTNKRSELKEEIKVKSAENLEKLRAALATAPESARPALEKAIRDTASSYQEVLKDK